MLSSYAAGSGLPLHSKDVIEVPQIWQWDDHEVINNWSSAKDLAADARYTEKSVPLLAARAKRAFLEYAPLSLASQVESERVYRKISYGPLLDLFVIDMRSYRGPNSQNLQAGLSAETAFLGRSQLQWLSDGLSASRARWKVIASDMPLALVVSDGELAPGKPRFEGAASPFTVSGLGSRPLQTWRANR